MSDLVKNHGVTKLLHIYLLISILSLMAIVTIIPSPNYQLNMQKEVKMLATLVDVGAWQDVTNNVTAHYQQWYVNSGFHKAVNDTFLPSGDYKIRKIVEKYKGEVLLERAANNIHLMAYQICYRVYLLQYWMILLIPTFIALTYDGFVQRRIRMYEPQQISIKGSRLWTRSMVYIFILTFAYLIIPNWFGPIAASLPLAMLLLFCVAVRYVIANYMKVA